MRIRRTAAAGALALAACSSGAGGVPAAEPVSADTATVEIPPVSEAPAVAEPARDPLPRSSAVAEPAPSAANGLPPECVAYLDIIERCASTVPPGGREPMLEAMRATRKAWESAAESPAVRESLATACKSAADAMKQPGACGP
ncbi:MAG TPA: hypothetical protein VL400_27410 [Polyangiaceae bacterium]|nr:hypothetical protein [Polyangiaceae bacterium]